MKRIRMKTDRIPPKERPKRVRAIISELSAKLMLGWNPLIAEKAHKSFHRLFDAFNDYLTVKGKECEASSMRCYRSYLKNFEEWLRANGFNNDSYSSGLSEIVAREYMNSMDSDEDISARTFNNYLKFLIGVFNWMMDKGYCTSNPFIKIAKKPKRLTKKTRRLFSDEELARMETYLLSANPQYLVATMLCYYCFLRPKEIALLKCADIDLSKQMIHVRPEIAKNDNDSHRTIPDNLATLIKAHIDLSDGSLYVFSMKKGIVSGPGSKLMCSRELARYWNNAVRANCGFPMELQFYSLKDTGITNMLSKGVAITTVQAQADHSSVAMTSVYVGKKANATEEIKHLEM